MMMGSWLSRVFRASSGAPARTSPAVINAVRQAMDNGSTIVLEAAGGVVATTLIQQVSGDEIVVAQPSVGGIAYPFAENESFKLSFVAQETNLSGRTTCLGRVRSGSNRSGGFVYRLAMPGNLRFEDRRNEPRNPIHAHVAPEVRIIGARGGTVLMGTLADISITGLRVHVLEQPSGVELNQELTMQFRMPDPAGDMDEVVEVQRLCVDDNGMHAICCSFRRRVPRLEALLRLTTEREPMPLQQAQRRVA